MDKYGIIGYPLGHSYSRGFFTDKFKKEGIDAQYLNFPITGAEQLRVVIEENPELRGLNVTLPYKQAVIPLLDELSDEAREIGAVNVIRVRRKNGVPYLKGFNSDIIGFMNSIRLLLKSNHRKALILGTGGASRAIRVGLERLGIDWTYVSRTPAEGRFTYDELTPEILQEYQVVVNCSPVGMYPNCDACPAIPYEALVAGHLLFDVVYNPEETLFMKRGAEQGAVVKNGLEMLYLQAVASWDFWNSEI
ncbi:MAG: shikimate dehydrogenase [Bacteroidaceae bacterium]|nr:shikimate dehydrogenase [Bacteroidaceae bacterium]